MEPHGTTLLRRTLPTVMLKLHILHNLREGPWGGGNQFLKALRDEWIRQGVYSDAPVDAQVIFINSYPFGAEYLFDQLFNLKKGDPKKIVVYRLNGPISSIRNTDKEVDEMIGLWNRLIADGIIFQSHWCAEKNKTNFNISSAYQTVIHNAPNARIFYPDRSSTKNPSKIRLIATSWSANPRKGFDIYQYLDTHLDFQRYEMTFVGNAPITFQQIKTMKAVDSETLACLLREHDIFITASQSDPCSNSLIEALSCGLPAVALKDGGHPELVQTGGALFEGTQDVLTKINEVADHLEIYKRQLPCFRLTMVAREYHQFANQIFKDVQAGAYQSKQPSLINFYCLKGMMLSWKLKNAWKKFTNT